jgi:hypothetical protein
MGRKCKVKPIELVSNLPIVQGEYSKTLTELAQKLGVYEISSIHRAAKQSGFKVVVGPYLVKGE